MGREGCNVMPLNLFTNKEEVLDHVPELMIFSITNFIHPLVQYL